MERSPTRILIEGVRSDRGQVACALFAAADGFPSEQDKASVGQVASAKSGTLEFVFEGVPHGRYAISVLHDENSNGRLDTNLLGMPQEGYGVSGDAFRRFGPPRYADALIDLGPGAAVVIPMRYP